MALDDFELREEGQLYYPKTWRKGLLKFQVRSQIQNVIVESEA